MYTASKIFSGILESSLSRWFNQMCCGYAAQQDLLALVQWAVIMEPVCCLSGSESMLQPLCKDRSLFCFPVLIRHMGTHLKLNSTCDIVIGWGVQDETNTCLPHNCVIFVLFRKPSLKRTSAIFGCAEIEDWLNVFFTTLWSVIQECGFQLGKTTGNLFF